MDGLGFGSVLAVNPPYIRFETRAVARQRPQAEGGGLFYEDVDFALVTSHGSKDTVEKITLEWFTQLKEQIRQGRFPQQWLDAYKAAYAAWKNDQELPVVGTPIKNWPVATPAEMKIIGALGIRAVEDLANANEELISKLGMGGRSLASRAKDWVLTSQGQAPLVAQMDSLRQINMGQQRTIDALTQRIGILEARLAQSAQTAPQQSLPPLEDRLSQAQAKNPGMSDDEAIRDALEA
jgi:hypothetical protein